MFESDGSKGKIRHSELAERLCSGQPPPDYVSSTDDGEVADAGGHPSFYRLADGARALFLASSSGLTN